MVRIFDVFALYLGILRGIVANGTYLKQGVKLGDVDPRPETKSHCFTISDKSRCISGGVVEAVFNSLRSQ